MRRRRFGQTGAATLGAFAGMRPGRVGAQAEVVSEELHIITRNGFMFDGLDPTLALSASRLRKYGSAEGLFTISSYGSIEPELASGYEMFDPLTWRVDLRPNVKFWSGKAVDARAVVESLERARQLIPFAASLLSGVRVEPADERTLYFYTEVPQPALPTSLATEWLVIHNAESYGPRSNPFDLGAADLTGYYRPTSFDPGRQVHSVRHPRYWGTPPRPSGLRVDVIGDTDARTLAALGGEAHIVMVLNTATARQIERSRTMRLEPIMRDAVTSVYFNLERPQLSDVRVRQALAWATDREEIVALAKDGWGAPVPSWLANDLSFPEAKRVGYTRYDPARAAQLLDGAGWRLTPGSRFRTKDGVPLKLRLLWSLVAGPIAEVMQQQWAKVGVDVEVQGAQDSGLMNARRDSGDWDNLLSTDGTFGDPAAVLARRVGVNGDTNYGKFNDPVMESLLAGFAGLTDPEERRQQALKVNERQVEMVPFFPLVTSVDLNAVSRKVRNYVPHFLSHSYEVHPDLWAAV